ncbi:MAG TPA: FixH family protein [Pyrinomonadaceae bacterium]
MKPRYNFSPPAKTTAGRCTLWLLMFALAAFTFAGCGSRTAQQAEAEHDEEAEARTEFTNRIENFFEYDPLHAGKPSQFLIHLTDLSDGTPVEQAEVTLNIRSKGGAQMGQVKAKVGKVTGIYVAEVSIPAAGDYDIEFHVKNPKLDERMSLTDFKVE